MRGAAVATSAPGLRLGGAVLRPEERALLGTGGVVFALASAGAAMSAAAADAMFLSEIGPSHLGEAVAASSALLAVVLAVVGGLADRLERRRVLATLATISAIVIAGLAALSAIAPSPTAVLTLVGGKQLAAATDLAFWVVIAERLDARRSQRLLPIIAAMGGAGAAIGAVLVVPIASELGARGVLVTSAILLALAALGAARLPQTRRVKTAAAHVGALLTRSWRDGARAVRRHPLARHLAIVVFAGGVFASLVYFALGVEVAHRGGSTAELAAILGGVRGGAQIVTLIVQLALTPFLLARLGTGRAMLVAPLVALASGLGLVIAPILAVAIAAQASARVLDASVETPAERLAQTLLPVAMRGRVAGFLDGTAKRAGAVIGGLVAAILAGSPAIFYAITAIAAALWLIASARIARALPSLAVEQITHVSDADAAVDDRALQALVRELDGPRPERAAEVIARLHERGRVDAIAPLVKVATQRGGVAVWRALVQVLEVPAEVYGEALSGAVVDAAKGIESADRDAGVISGSDAYADARREGFDARPDAPARTRFDAPRAEAPQEPGSDAAAERELDGRLQGVRAPRAFPFGSARGSSESTIALQRELAIRALGLARGASPDAHVALTSLVASRNAAIALSAELAILRLTRAKADADGAGDLLTILGDAVRDSGVNSRVAIDELCVETARALAQLPVDEDRVLEVARHLSRALRRKRGDGASRQAGFTALARVVAWARDRRDAELALLRADLLELVRERVETAASPVAPEHALTSLLRVPDSSGDEPPEIAAALRLYGNLLEGADAVEPEDLRRVARALGEPDDEVRAAAEEALTALGPAAAGELIATAAWGRRRARDRAAALLAELPVTAGALDRLVDAELDALDATHAAIAVLDQPGDELLARRLDERLREIAHTVLLLVAARRRSRAIADAAKAWRHARGAHERARTLAVIDAALPRALVSRLVEAVDDLTPADRAAHLANADIACPSRDEVIRAELAGRDRLARGLVLHLLGAAGRNAHRDQITNAARVEALAATPADLLRRVTEALSTESEPEPIAQRATEGDDMPSRVETLIALGKVPLLASLSTRQLADVAERARWSTIREGSVVVTAGDAIDALILVDDGELVLGDRLIGNGDVVDELAPFAPAPIASDLRARRASRLVRLERIDFEELVDDVPGLAAAVCRGLGERARRAEDHGYRSPLSTQR
ncbi:MAG: MFS transporter [Kofleriaceae bacterium]